MAKELGEINEKEVHVTIRNRRPLALSFTQEEMAQEPQADESQAEESHLTICSVAENKEDWRAPFIEYFKHGTIPKEKGAADQLKKRVLRYVYANDTLYRRSYDQLWLRCLSPEEAGQVIKEVHEGICGAHQSGPKMRFRIKQLGYYWPTMVADCEEFAKRCHMCQIHGTFIHQAPNPLHPTVASWPFSTWGTDIVGPIDPPSSKGHRFILAATDYFSKWAEAMPLKEVKASDVVRFFKTHVLYRFGTPRRIISDNGTAFQNAKVYKMAKQFG